MKNKLFLAALTAVAVLSSCNNENEPLLETKEVVHFMVDKTPITRTAINTSDFSTSFAVADQIGVYATGGATASNVGYKIASDGSALEATGDGISWSSNAAGNFYAYYPYAESQASTGKVVFTASNQDTQENFNANDFLTCTNANVGFNTENITLAFTHGLSLVQVVLTGMEATNVTEVAIKAQPTAEWTYSTNEIAVSGTAKDIKMWKYTSDDSSASFIAMVPAQTLSKSVALFTLKTATKAFTYTPSDDITIQKGYSKKFKLQIGELGNVTALATAAVPVGGWKADDTDVEGEATEAEVPVVAPVELISEAAGKISSSTTLTPQTGKQDCAEGWNVIGNGGNATFEIENEEDVYAISMVSSTGSWYNSTLYYCTAEGVATEAKYKLTFELKASAEGDVQLALMSGGITANNYFIQVNDGQSGISYQTATTDWTTKSLTFDLSKIRKTSATAAVASSTSEDLKKILVYFTAKDKGDTKFYIRNVKLIEAK